MNGYGQMAIEFNGVGIGAKNGIRASLERDLDPLPVIMPMRDILRLTFQNPLGVDSYILLVDSTVADSALDNLHCTGAIDSDHISQISGWRMRTSGNLYDFPVSQGIYKAIIWLDAADASLNNKIALASLERAYAHHPGPMGAHEKQVVAQGIPA